MRSRLFLIVSTLLISANIFAGGFQLNEHGARALAMGGAFTSVANDASAIYWNGAGISFLKGTNIVFGASFIAPSSKFRGVTPDVTEYRGKNLLFYPVHFFATTQLSDKFSVGLGFTTPFGLGTEWDENWVGKYLAIETSLQTFIVTPVISYKPIESLAISAGFVYSFADVLITRKNPLQPIFASDAFIHLEGNDMFAYGFNAGIMFKPTKCISIGASYHSEVKYEFEGTATSTGPDQVAASLPKGDITAELSTPQNIAGGIAIDVSPRVKISADFQYVGWSSYDTLAVTFVETGVVSASPRMYEDSYIIRLGGSYKANDQVTFMGGVYYDKNPVSNEYLNPSLPESNRIGLSFGIEAQLFENLSVQGSYLFIRGKQLTITDSKEIYTSGNGTFNGTYNTSANIFGLSFNLSL
ncbi:MAG: outer membrane protein transport protein [Ignavibacteriales bacterium]|nr:outer membrane protein transport protein [Ignavibacteriales bacterium]